MITHGDKSPKSVQSLFLNRSVSTKQVQSELNLIRLVANDYNYYKPQQPMTIDAKIKAIKQQLSTDNRIPEAVEAKNRRSTLDRFLLGNLKADFTKKKPQEESIPDPKLLASKERTSSVNTRLDANRDKQSGSRNCSQEEKKRRYPFSDEREEMKRVKIVEEC